MTISTKILFVTVLAAMVIGGMQPARADWTNRAGTAPNIAEIYVLDDRVRVKLEVYIGDLDKFSDLLLDDWLRDASGRPGLGDRMQRFSRPDCNS